VAIGLPGKKKISSRFAGLGTLSMALYYRQFSITDLQLIWLHQTYIEAQHFSGLYTIKPHKWPRLCGAAIENIAFPFTGQSSSRLSAIGTIQLWVVSGKGQHRSSNIPEEVRPHPSHRTLFIDKERVQCPIKRFELRAVCPIQFFR
jgi:hypothetical protein